MFPFHRFLSNQTDMKLSFDFDCFVNKQLDEAGEEGRTTSGNVRKDLTEWQERHATALLLKVKVWISNCIVEF